MRAREVIISPQAQEDLTILEDYLVKNAGRRVATAVLRNVFFTIGIVSIVPFSAPTLAERPGRRMRPCRGNARNWLLFWEMANDAVVILAVLRAENQSRRDELGDSSDA